MGKTWVMWAPGSKRLGKHSAEHQVVSGRFELNVCGQTVGYLLMIRPARTQNRKGVLRAAFKNTQQRQIQLKCLDDLEGQGLWDLPAAKRGEKPIVIKVDISAAPSRW